MNKKGLSPLVATGLLLVFALIIGTITMSWGKSYIADIAEQEPEEDVLENKIVVNLDEVDTALKKLQLDYITGKISEDEYREREKELIE